MTNREKDARVLIRHEKRAGEENYQFELDATDKADILNALVLTVIDTVAAMRMPLAEALDIIIPVLKKECKRANTIAKH